MRPGCLMDDALWTNTASEIEWKFGCDKSQCHNFRSCKKKNNRFSNREFVLCDDHRIMILRVELVLTGARAADATKAEKITKHTSALSHVDLPREATVKSRILYHTTYDVTYDLQGAQSNRGVRPHFKPSCLSSRTLAQRDATNTELNNTARGRRQSYAFCAAAITRDNGPLFAHKAITTSSLSEWTNNRAIWRSHLPGEAFVVVALLRTGAWKLDRQDEVEDPQRKKSLSAGQSENIVSQISRAVIGLRCETCMQV